MMSDINIYDISVGVYIAGVTALVSILQKAASEPLADTLPSARLIEDMKPLSFHVQSVSNTVCKSLKKLIGPVEEWEDNETSMEQLSERAVRTLAMLKAIQPKILEGKETITVAHPYGRMNGKQFILGFGIPSFFFHLQTAYSILRMHGVPLGKADFMDCFNGPWNSIQENSDLETK